MGWVFCLNLNDDFLNLVFSDNLMKEFKTKKSILRIQSKKKFVHLHLHKRIS